MRTLLVLLLAVISALALVEYQTGSAKPYGYWTEQGPLPGGQYHQFTLFIPGISDVAEYGLTYYHAGLGRYSYVDDNSAKHYYSGKLDLYGLAVKLLVLPNTDWFPYAVCEPRGYMYMGNMHKKGVLGVPGEVDEAYTSDTMMMGGGIGLALGARWRPYGQIAFIYTHHIIGPTDPEGGPKYDAPPKATEYKGDMGVAVEVWIPEQSQ